MQEVALTASALIDLLTGTLGRWLFLGGRGSAHELLTREALGRFRAHLIQADHDTTFRRVRREFLKAPFFMTGDALA